MMAVDFPILFLSVFCRDTVTLQTSVPLSSLSKRVNAIRLDRPGAPTKDSRRSSPELGTFCRLSRCDISFNGTLQITEMPLDIQFDWKIIFEREKPEILEPCAFV